MLNVRKKKTQRTVNKHQAWMLNVKCGDHEEGNTSDRRSTKKGSSGKGLSGGQAQGKNCP